MQQHGVPWRFVVESEDEAVDAVRRVRHLDRRGVRAAFDQRFTARRMAEDYLAYYNTLVVGEPAVAPLSRSAVRPSELLRRLTPVAARRQG